LLGFGFEYRGYLLTLFLETEPIALQAFFIGGEKAEFQVFFVITS
jgi:hypothetical protein